ncbi:MAG TPA: hypothetical protein VL137_17650 [Polyangiaceae bacterium]|nr:hypothetical protein [Polyangiaceae bacterium]
MTTLTLHRMANAGCLVVTILLQIACSSSAGEVAARPHGDDDMITPGATGHSSGASFTDQCAVGQQRICSFHLPEHNGVQPCVIGVQTCVDRSWGRCMEGTLADAQAPELAEPSSLADAGAPPAVDADLPTNGQADPLQSP